MYSATIGTGTLSLGAAVAGHLTFAQAGITDGQTVSYAIIDGNNTEVGRGVYTSSGTTLSRSVLLSTNSNNAISLTGGAEVFITALAEDIPLALISEVVTSGSASSVAFSSIPQIYRDLELRVRGRGTQASATVKPRIRYNGDSGNNYNNQGFHSAGSGGTNAEQLGVSYNELGDIPAASGTSGYSGLCIADIIDYRGTTFNKPFSSRDGNSYTNTSGQTLAGIFGGCWRTVGTPITSISVFLSAGNFVDGSVVSLYGRR